MKLLKIILFFTTLFIVSPTNTRQTKSTIPQAPRPMEVPQPSVQNSYNYLLGKIRIMPSTDVIDEQGVFKDQFINMVKTANLSPELTEALFQAGRNLHLPLSGDNAKDTELLANTSEQISGLMVEQASKVEWEETIAPAPTGFPEFYDAWTNEIKQNYLDNRVIELLQRDPELKNLKLLENELISKMLPMWQQRGFKDTTVRTTQLRKQLKDTVSKWQPAIGAPQKKTTPDFYDDWTNLLNERYLEKEVTKLLKKDPSGKQANNVAIQLWIPMMVAEWEGKGKLNDEIQQLRIQVSKQINETIRRLKK